MKSRDKVNSAMSVEKILVVAHKIFDDSNLPNGYNVTKVGNNRFALPGGWSDCDGDDNISHENPWYCELTAQYWAWKNLPEDMDVIGLVHYRRYFMSYKVDSRCFWDDVLSIEEARNILHNYKMIIPFKTAKRSGGSILYRNRIMNEHDKHWVIIYQIMREKYPDYLKSFEKVIFGKKQVWFNMFIASKKIFDLYSQWFFGVLKEYDTAIKSIGENRVPRVDGFLSELLLLVWVDKNIAVKEIKYLDVKNIEANGKLTYSSNFTNKICKMLYSNYNLLKLYKNMKASFDVIYRTIFEGL